MKHAAQQFEATAPRAGAIPLVVDLDGTLLKTDLLFEALLHLLAVQPMEALKTPLWLLDGKALFKARLADAAVIDLHLMPLNAPVLALITDARAAGRPVFLASASARPYVKALAAHLGLFDGVYASDGTLNLSGPRKAEQLVAAFGAGGFDYVGNAAPDLAVWAQCRVAYLVDASAAVTRKAKSIAPAVEVLSDRQRPWQEYLRAMRLHQWLKNVLLFVPGIAAHITAPSAYLLAVLAFVSFSLCASSVYLLNDLLDLRGDRAHHTKRTRPFAAGTIPLLDGLILFPLLLGGAVLLGALTSWRFLGVLLFYYVLTLSYSLVVKRLLMLDVIVLAGLYGMRVIAGAAVFAVPLSEWLMAFCVFLFLSLSLVKRAAELAARAQRGGGDPSGRAYKMGDLGVLEMMATASGFLSILVLALYINSDDIADLYSRKELLWLVSFVLSYWIGRVLILTHRGEMHDDPVIFATTDRTSQVCGAVIIALVAAASL